MNKHYDYNGKTIFVGIDVHKKTYSVAVFFDDQIVKRDTLPAIPQKLMDYFNKFFKNAHIKSAYEAGFSGFGLHRFLRENGVENIVVHAASIEIGARDKVKNDKRDATKIAVQLAAKRLRGIFVPSPEQESRRELTRLRSKFVKERNRTAAIIKLKANFYGLLGPEDSQKVSGKWIQKLKLKAMSPEQKFVLEELIELWEMYNSKVKKLDGELQKQAFSDDKSEKIYRSASGIGPTSARILSNELGDMSQFESEGQLYSYVGLTPAEYSSGEHTRRGRITKQGKPILRSILVQCAWVAIRRDKSLEEVYERLKARAGPKRAIVAIARRLIGRVRACFRKGELYEEKKLIRAKEEAKAA